MLTLGLQFENERILANSLDQDQTPNKCVSELGPSCLAI